MLRLPESLDLLVRELVFRAVCRHRPGTRPNILLHCSRRGGSTWLLNTMAAHPGVRYVGQPFLKILRSRWRRRMPDLAAAAEHTGEHRFRQVIHFEGEAEERFRRLAGDVVSGRIHVYPSLAFRAPYFHRTTDRVVFQMTSGAPLIEWFDEHFPVQTVMLFRHPVPVALSTMRAGWPPEARDFLHHRWFVDTHLDGGQVDRAESTLASGDALAAHVLDWALKMLIPFRALASGRHPGWLALTYEEAVNDPDRVLGLISERLDLPDRATMRRQMERPSRTVARATADRIDDGAYLVGRWRRRVGRAEERRLLDLVHAFGIDLYEPGRDGARAPFLA